MNTLYSPSFPRRSHPIKYNIQHLRWVNIINIYQHLSHYQETWIPNLSSNPRIYVFIQFLFFDRSRWNYIERARVKYYTSALKFPKIQKLVLPWSANEKSCLNKHVIQTLYSEARVFPVFNAAARVLSGRWKPVFRSRKDTAVCFFLA